jgi:arylsulfatase A-like enzyme
LEQNIDADNFFLLVESFDPHEPWFVPPHYRKMYDSEEGREQVISIYDSTEDMDPQVLRRTRANYSGLVTMCDRWFGYFYETLRVLGFLENTLIVVASDHGYSIGDRDYMGKSGYPSAPEVYEIPIIIRHPEGIGAGIQSDAICQHTDISAVILEAARVQPKNELDGRSFWQTTLNGEPHRDHMTAAWSTGMTVVDDKWWLNCKVDSTGPFLHDLSSTKPYDENVADDNPEIVKELYKLGVEDAGGEFPE